MADRYAINRAIFDFMKKNDKKTGAVADRAGIRRDVFSRILHCRRPIYAYKTAMQLLQSGSMASDELLESAGISKADAQAMVAAVAAQKATAVAAQKATAKSSGRTTTPSKTRAAVSREILLSNGYDEDAWRDLEA